jgi:hypothetical protein
MSLAEQLPESSSHLLSDRVSEIRIANRRKMLAEAARVLRAAAAARSRM